ncbi:Protein of unknown function (DUF1759) [Nesidiocoris tenuis]|uniref:Uncharacterized protein n=1 Tax=Nesidiocoris tenuis TaxID=355587 RepID=A0ABN7APT4_9HEMI|nr:Protein of unknown function (DUF1759) [Nesidiocoris tenuis]
MPPKRKSFPQEVLSLAVDDLDPDKISLNAAVVSSLADNQQGVYRDVRRWSVRLAPVLKADPSTISFDLLQEFNIKGKSLLDAVEGSKMNQEVEELLVTKISEILLRISAVLSSKPLPENPAPVPAESKCDTHRTYSAVKIMNELLTTVPVFNGDITRFAEFRRLFDRAVHNLDNVPDEIKYEKLLSKLSPETRSSFVASVQDGSNYRQLYDALCAENTAKYRLARSAFAKRSQIPKLSGQSVQELDRFVNEARLWANMMSDLPTENLAEFLLFEALFHRLSPDLREKFNRDEMESADGIPSHNQLLAFVEKELKIARMLPADSSTSRGSRSISSSRTPLAKPRSPSPYKSAGCVNNLSSARPAPNKITCHYCHQNHCLFKCQAFRALSVQERNRLVDVFRACRNCFSPLHSTAVCPSDRRCHCQEKHHPWLHINAVQPVNEPEPSAFKPQMGSTGCSYVPCMRSPPPSPRFITRRPMADSGPEAMSPEADDTPASEPWHLSS